MIRLLWAATVGLPLALTFATFFLPPLPALAWSVFIIWVYLVLYVIYKLTRCIYD